MEMTTGANETNFWLVLCRVRIEACSSLLGTFAVLQNSSSIGASGHFLDHVQSLTNRSELLQQLDRLLLLFLSNPFSRRCFRTVHS
jgi:hypothetical protein